jgi:hypothetical protein
MPASPDFPGRRGSVKIKNKTGTPYVVVELGSAVTIPAGGEIDLLDDQLARYYGDYDAAHRLVSELATAKLRQDIVAGDIEVTLDRPSEW